MALVLQSVCVWPMFILPRIEPLEKSPLGNYFSHLASRQLTHLRRQCHIALSPERQSQSKLLLSGSLSAHTVCCITVCGQNALQLVLNALNGGGHN